MLCTLHTLGNPRTSTQEIKVTTPTKKPETLTASMGDAQTQRGWSGGKIWATVRAEHFAADLKVATVTAHSGDGRIYDVKHAGRRATVAPATLTTVFAGAPIAGDWILSTPLIDDQTCATIPHNLVVNVTTQYVPQQDDDSRRTQKNVDTIVVVIMENRSFDHVLGHLRCPIYGNRREVEGIEDVANPDYLNPNNDGEGIAPFWTADGPLNSDLPHDPEAVAKQLAYSQAMDRYFLTGFVKAFEDEFHT